MGRVKSEAQKRAQIAYMDKQARLGLVMSKDKKAQIQRAAEQAQMSMNEFVLFAVDDKLHDLKIE